MGTVMMGITIQIVTLMMVTVAGQTLTQPTAWSVSVLKFSLQQLQPLYVPINPWSGIMFAMMKQTQKVLGKIMTHIMSEMIWIHQSSRGSYCQ